MKIIKNKKSRKVYESHGYKKQKTYIGLVRPYIGGSYTLGTVGMLG